MRTRDEFEYWLFDLADELDGFFETLPQQVRDQLDFSPESLDVLEKMILDRYPDTESMVTRYELKRVDDYGRYIGETFRRTIGGRWDINLDDPADILYGLPVVTG